MSFGVNRWLKQVWAWQPTAVSITKSIRATTRFGGRDLGKQQGRAPARYRNRAASFCFCSPLLLCVRQGESHALFSFSTNSTTSSHVFARGPARCSLVEFVNTTVF